MKEQPHLSEKDLTSEFARLAPWIYKFQIGGMEYGGTIGAAGDVRIEQFFRFAGSVTSILELGALEGAQTMLLTEQPEVERVLALEGREANLRKARFIQEQLEVRKAEFVQENLEEADLSKYGQFDAVFCCGLLYHLPEPWKLIRQLPSIAPVLFLWTAYAAENEAQILPNGMRGKVQLEGGLDEPLSGLSPTATWLTLDGLRAMLTICGYEQVEVIQDDPAHVNCPTVSIGARRERSYLL